MILDIYVLPPAPQISVSKLWQCRCELLIPKFLIYDLTSDIEEIRVINSSTLEFWKLGNTMTGGSNTSSRAKCCLVPRETAQINNCCIFITSVMKEESIVFLDWRFLKTFNYLWNLGWVRRVSILLFKNLND